MRFRAGGPRRPAGSRFVRGKGPSGAPFPYLALDGDLLPIDLITIVVDDYDPAIAFFTDVLGFTLAEDSPSLTNDGRPKRWVVVRPPDGGTGILLAQADGAEQSAVVGRQLAGRVGFFLRVADFDAVYARLSAAGVRFAGEPRDEPYGRVVVFHDIAGNPWDLLGPS